MKSISLAAASSALVLVSTMAVAQQDSENRKAAAEPAEQCLNQLDRLESETEQAQLSVATQEEVRQLTESARMLGERGRADACETMVETISSIAEEEQARMGQQQERQAMRQAKPITDYDDIVRTSAVNGATVRNGENQELGTIEDAVIDPRSGEISYVVLSVGGFLGIGDKSIAVPWDELKIVEERDTERTYYVLDASRNYLQQRQALDEGNWPRKVSPRWEPSEAAGAAEDQEDPLMQEQGDQ